MLAVLGAGLLASACASAQSGYRDDARWGNGGNRTVRCESYDRQRQECRVNTRGGVRLVRQLSDRECREGRDWGYGRNSIWVSGGCRAEFEVGRGNGGGWGGGGGGGWGNGGVRTVRCESYDRQLQHCRADTRGGVRLVRQLSDRECREGRDWGTGRDVIWVSGGCRAEFEVGRGSGGGGGWGGGTRTVRCESYDRQLQHCRADTRGGVRLVRKLSDRECREGRDWGTGRDVIWVSGGCRAEFEVGDGRWR
ncbi:DUF3011 domain-containing protein [Luteimonas aquatica]|uniref:DUF3011 domain-containing protein n=1 Tax=Luteimonas aquatica TaxID=450364 RepID=UPI001F5918FD|nr:DUF3011 domain-containing protein [Luteimonas aquatica]